MLGWMPTSLLKRRGSPAASTSTHGVHFTSVLVTRSTTQEQKALAQAQRLHGHGACTNIVTACTSTATAPSREAAALLPRV